MTNMVVLFHREFYTINPWIAGDFYETKYNRNVPATKVSVEDGITSLYPSSSVDELRAIIDNKRTIQIVDLPRP